ncbi:sulfite exporter TauE/SafE family protein [Svornostia abyssi]|uniref:Probable membrane transporter protein n=1 Tax=Svornostia abyssi TaxID=2898438 RepID=A0ABY5PI88_9ACTN|nr:sulfite exporter TauE/SafE family protein [Parviterribacteraceae bacterium J379]
MVVDLSAPAGRTARLAAIGTLAGLFSGLFGVGGGVVMVPLLMVWLGYGAREATGTSLAAIIVIAAVAVATHAGYGNVDVEKGLLVGVPAIGGVLAGTWLQQRVPQRAIALGFAAVLVGVAVRLVVG